MLCNVWNYVQAWSPDFWQQLQQRCGSGRKFVFRVHQTYIFSCSFLKKWGKTTHRCFSILWAFGNTFRLKLNPDPNGWSHRPLWYSSHVFFRGAQVQSEVHSRARSDCLFCFVQFPRSARGHTLCCSYLGPLIAVIKRWECRQVAWGCDFPFSDPCWVKTDFHSACMVTQQMMSGVKGQAMSKLTWLARFSSEAEQELWMRTKTWLHITELQYQFEPVSALPAAGKTQRNICYTSPSWRQEQSRKDSARKIINTQQISQ